MYRVAVIGDKESVYGFQSIGLDVFYADNGEDTVKTLKKLCENPTYSIIFITEALSAYAQSEIDKYSCMKTPAIILIPGTSGNTGRGINAVRESVIKAVGSDIIFND